MAYIFNWSFREKISEYAQIWAYKDQRYLIHPDIFFNYQNHKGVPKGYPQIDEDVWERRGTAVVVVGRIARDLRRRQIT